MVYTDPFHSPKSRLRRAQEHAAQIESKAKTFFDTKPYASFIEDDPDGISKLHKVKLTQVIPEEIDHLTTECAEAMRSALDYCGYSAALLAGSGNLGSGTYFPFGDSATGLDHTIKRNCRKIPADIVALFRAFKPYLGGDDLLYALNQMCGRTKHRMIVPATSGADIRLMLHELRAGSVGAGILKSWDREKQEVELLSIGPDGYAHYDVQIAFFIAFGKVPVVEGQPVLAVLNALISKVESIILATEAECRRIGLL
jgi:hypothetical protein